MLLFATYSTAICCNMQPSASNSLHTATHPSRTAAAKTTMHKIILMRLLRIAHFIKYYKYLSDFVKRLDRFTTIRQTSFPPLL